MRDLGADMWSHRGGIGSRDYRVTPDQLRTLETSGIGFEVVVPNVQSLVDAERASVLNPRGLGGYFDSYQRYEDMSQFVNDLQIAHPGRAARVSVGQSLESREIFGVKITGSNGPSEKPAVVFSAMQHAREWVAGTTALYLANELVEGYGSDARITAALDAVDVYIIPVINPDGYVWSWDVERLWRKNRRVNGGGTFGVDTNRNFSIGWGLNGGSDTSTSSETYRGVAPFSEPESAALANFIESIPNVRAHVDLHSYSELVLSPWGWTEDPTPDAAAFDSLNATLQSAIADVDGRVYTAGPAGSTLYIASGTAPDWTYGELGAFGWTIELRPASASLGGFVLPPDQIIPTGEEILPALLVLTEFAADDIYFYGLREPIYIDSSAGAEVSIGATPTRGAAIDESSSALRYRIGGAGSFLSAPLSFGGMHVATGQFPPSACGQDVEYYFEIVTASGLQTFPEAGEAAPRSLTVLDASIALDDDFSSDLGWTVGATGDAATTGVWVRGVPNATNYQPGSGDPNGSGGECFYTGFSNPGAGDGAEDIDGGATTFTSPLIDATTGAGEAYLSYSRWLGSNGSGGSDYLRTFLSNDDGANWTLVDSLTQDTRVWTPRQIRIAEFMVPTSAMRVRFVAADAGSASVSEAAVDDVRIVILGCDAQTGDINGDGVVNFTDLNAVLGSFGATGAPGFDPADLDNDGDVDFTDLNTVLANFGSSN
jgi:murein tripeptide amidase MpaA